MGSDNKKGASEFYQTFDSGSGPVISDKDSYDHKDSGSGLSNYTMNKVDGLDTEVPEVQPVKR